MLNLQFFCNDVIHVVEHVTETKIECIIFVKYLYFGGSATSYLSDKFDMVVCLNFVHVMLNLQFLCNDLIHVVQHVT